MSVRGPIFFSCGQGVLSVFHETSADVYEDAGAIQTQQSAKTMAIDPKTKKIFLPAAEFQIIPATEAGGKPTRKMTEGSFVLLVVSR